MKKNLKRILIKLLCLPVMGVSVCLADAGATSPMQSLPSYIQMWQQHYHLPAVVVTISRPGRAAQTLSSGYADLATKQPIKADSLFAIGSITKTFVSAMILRLVAQGKLNLDDPVDKWLPQYALWHDLTLRQLLNMTSGIVRFTENDTFAQTRQANPTQHWTAQQLIDMAYQHPNYFRPGTQWQYSNTNYLLLGLIIEKITQQPLAWVLQRNFFQPIGLTHTFFISNVIPPALMPLMAHGYQQNSDVTGHDFSVYGASGAILSNTKDMVKWLRALFTQVLPKQQLAQLMTTYQYSVPFEPAGSAYGLGIFSLPTQSLGTVWWYAGVVEGYSALVIWVPSRQTAIAVTINAIPDGNTMLLFPQQALFQYLLAYIT